MLLHVLIVYSFLWLGCSSLWEVTLICLSINQLYIIHCNICISLTTDGIIYQPFICLLRFLPIVLFIWRCFSIAQISIFCYYLDCKYFFLLCILLFINYAFWWTEMVIFLIVKCIDNFPFSWCILCPLQKSFPIPRTLNDFLYYPI